MSKIPSECSNLLDSFSRKAAKMKLCLTRRPWRRWSSQLERQGRNVHVSSGWYAGGQQENNWAREVQVSDSEVTAPSFHLTQIFIVYLFLSWLL